MNLEVLRGIAAQVGDEIDEVFDGKSGYDCRPISRDQLERFAALVAAHEREECASIVENNNGEVDGFDSPSVYAAIKDAALKIRSRNKQ